jgi:hypothetical protein
VVYIPEFCGVNVLEDVGVDLQSVLGAMGDLVHHLLETEGSAYGCREWYGELRQDVKPAPGVQGGYS